MNTYRTGNIPWNKNKHHSKETKRKMRKNHADFSGNKHPRFIKGITKEFLIKEYSINKKSPQQIANIFNCNIRTIRRRLIKLGIKLRTKQEAQKYSKSIGNYIDGRTKAKHYCIEPNCNNKISYNNWKVGGKRCMFCANKGSRSRTYGKKAKHGKGKKYKGIYMRSSWEIAYAKYLDKQGIKWLYEPKRFYFKDCTYLPDFYLLKKKLYIEIKGWWRKNTRKRFELFKKKYPKIKIKVLMQKELKKLGILK